jgi:hypothetical protein
MFGSRLREEYETIIQAYRNDLADARAEIARLRVEMDRREQTLLDRVLALTNPSAARVFNPPPPVPAQASANRDRPARIHWPGSDFATAETIIAAPEKEKE